jgi:hypothetical protein
MGVVSTEWKNEHLYESLLDLKTWFWFALLFSISFVIPKSLILLSSSLLTRHRIPSGGITTFGPLIVKGFGYNSFDTILLNIPFGAVQIVATLGGAAFATWTKKKGPALILLCIPPIIGCVMLLTIEHTAAHRGPLLVAYYLVCVYASSPVSHAG